MNIKKIYMKIIYSIIISVVFFLSILFIFSERNKDMSEVVYDEDYNDIISLIQSSPKEHFFDNTLFWMASYGKHKKADAIDYEKLMKVAEYYIHNGGDPLMKFDKLTAFDYAIAYNQRIAEIIKKVTDEYIMTHGNVQQ